MKINSLRFFRIAAIYTMLLITNTTAFAQPKVKDAANPTALPLRLCNSAVCTSGWAMQTTTTTPLRSINADMATIVDNGSVSASYPAYFGINTTWGNLWGIAFSGVTNVEIGNDVTGFTIGNTIVPGAFATLPIPYWFGAGSQMTGTANDPDIAIGTCYSTFASDSKHFALVVYELNGEIYMDHYEINKQPSGIITTMPPEPFTIPPCTTPPCATVAIPGNSTPVLLSRQSGGTASKPHIEIWHTRNIPTSGGVILATKYAVTWEQDDPHTGRRQVWGIDGEIDDPGTSFFPTPNQDFPIAFGKQSDVVAVNYFDVIASNPIREVAYVTYLSENPPFDRGRDVMLSDWDYNTQTVNSTIQLNTTSTQNDDEFELPRISGPMYYNYGAPTPDDPVCVVVVNDNDGNSTNLFNKVSAFKVYDPSTPTPIVEKLDISDYNNTDGFSSNGKTAIMPAVTGVGMEVANLAGLTAYNDYPAVFYSDHVNNSLDNNGDFYAFGLKLKAGFIDPELYPGGPDEYWEVNFDPLDNSNTPFDMAGVRPMIAVTTANNTGYDLLTTFYEGDNSDRVMYAFTGTAAKYDFKPGKPTAVQQVNQTGIAVYPNPVKDRLNITEADGADYTITDVTGRNISTGILSGSKAGVDASSLVPGMYILHISKDGHTEQVKFVKQ